MAGGRRSAFDDFGRCIDEPFLFACGKRSSPFLEASLAIVNFLASAYQGHDGSPVMVSLHDAQQHFWLGIIAIELLLVLSAIPGALSFVENDGVIGGSPGVVISVVACEDMNVFD